MLLVQENYEAQMIEKYGDNWATEHGDDTDLYLAASGGRSHGRFYTIDSVIDPSYVSAPVSSSWSAASGQHATSASREPDDDARFEQINNLLKLSMEQNQKMADDLRQKEEAQRRNEEALRTQEERQRAMDARMESMQAMIMQMSQQGTYSQRPYLQQVHKYNSFLNIYSSHIHIYLFRKGQGSGSESVGLGFGGYDGTQHAQNPGLYQSPPLQNSVGSDFQNLFRSPGPQQQQAFVPQATYTTHQNATPVPQQQSIWRVVIFIRVNY